MEREICNYANAAVNFYGVIKTDDLINIYNEYTNNNIEKKEFIKIIAKNSRIDKKTPFIGSLFKYNKKVDCFYNGLYLSEPKVFTNILKSQSDYQRYLPDKEIFIKYADNFYNDDYYLKKWQPLIKKISKYCDDQMKMHHFITELQLLPRLGIFKGCLCEEFAEYELDIPELKKEELEKDYMKATDITRSWALNGNTRNEVLRQMTQNKETKVGRNDPCPCGSDKKYKKCCLNKPSN